MVWPGFSEDPCLTESSLLSMAPKAKKGTTMSLADFLQSDDGISRRTGKFWLKVLCSKGHFLGG